MTAIAHIALTTIKIAIVISPFVGVIYAIGGFARLAV